MVDSLLSADEGPLGAVELSMSKSGEVTVSPTSAANNHHNHSTTLPPAITTAPTMVMSNHTKTPTTTGMDESVSILLKEQKEEEEKLLSNTSAGGGVGGVGGGEGEGTAVEMDLSVLRGIQPPPPEDEDEDEDDNVIRHNYGNGDGGKNHNSGKNIGNTTGAAAAAAAAAGGGTTTNPTRGVRLGDIFHGVHSGSGGKKNKTNGADLEALSELVPGLKTGQVGPDAVVVPPVVDSSTTMTTNPKNVEHSNTNRAILQSDSMAVNQDSEHVDGKNHMSTITAGVAKLDTLNEDNDDDNTTDDDKFHHILGDTSSDEDDDYDAHGKKDKKDNLNTTNDLIDTYTKTPAQKGMGDGSDESSDDSKSTAAKTHSSGGDKKLSAVVEQQQQQQQYSTAEYNYTDNNNMAHPYERQNLSTPPRPPQQQLPSGDESMYGATPNTHLHHPHQEFTHQSSVASISTATQTLQSHDMRTPMLYLPTFRPATGCTNASDFIVRCFVARLRSGITVVKHGRSRWCKSRLRILHVHSDGRSLSWKPAQGEPNSSKRPPKLDLSTCLEVRHAWSPDPQNPMFTGTPNLRSKCDASNAFKSFALIFPRRTVDITAVTADQCKVLMEGFSALCYRLQVANMVARGSRPGAGGAGAAGGGGGGESGGVSMEGGEGGSLAKSPKEGGIAGGTTATTGSGSRI